MIYQFLDSMIPIAVLVFGLSFKSSLLVFLIILIQLIFKYKLPSQWQYVLWFLIVFRLLLPFDMSSNYSFFNLISFSNSYVNEKVIAVTTETSKRVVEKQEIPVSSDNISRIKHDDRPLSLLHILALIWIFGIIIFSIILYRSNRKIYKILRGKSPVKDERVKKLFIHCIKKMRITSNIKLCELEDIKIPFIVGLFRPYVIIPANANNSLKPKQLYHIFLHELAHYKRYDTLIAWLTTVLNIIHWYNPVIWAAFYLMRLDREIACDTLALKYIKRERHKEYGHSILILMEKISYNFRTPLSVGLINNKFELSKRLKMLVCKSNKRRKWKILFICFFILLIIMSFTKYVPDLQIKEGLSIELEHENLSKYTVALIAGHGGKDPGGIGINGFKEKDLTLSISKKAQKELSKTGINVISIRKTDKFLPVWKRTAIIDSISPDIAIYIHSNWSRDNVKNGLSTYYQEHIKKSKILDSLFHEHLITHSSFVDSGSHTAPFWVLKGSNIPGVLIEAGYISNEEDLRKLKNDAFQGKLVLAIKEAVIEYFHNYNMHGSVVDDSMIKTVVTFDCPVDSGKIISNFGNRTHPLLKVKRHHDGIDIKTQKGFPVYATADGEIVFSGKNGGYGNTIKIKHKDSFQTMYGHLNDILVEAGQKVKRGDKIGSVGSTGLSTMPHLHYEIRKDGIPIDPINMLFSDKLTY